MGKKGKWFGAVKKIFSPESKRKKDEKSRKSATSGNSEPFERTVTEAVADLQSVAHPEEDRLVEGSKHSYPAAVPAKSEAALTSAYVAPVVIHFPARFAGKSQEEIAAIKIQTAFRGHLARRALRALKGLVKLKSLIDGNSVKRQAANTLRCMQTMARVQAQIRARRIRMSEENQALQRQLLLKHERDLESLKMGEEWDDSLQSKEQIEANLLSKQGAAVRRERAMAYAFSHQWKSSSKSVNPMFMDPNNPQWGWSWLERWMSARPWETKKTTDREFNNDGAPVKGSSQSIGDGEIIKSYARRGANPDKPFPVVQKPSRPISRQSPSTPKVPWAMGKIKSASPRGGWTPTEDDSRSVNSTQSERHRRHSVGASSFRDDESLASSPNIPRYMAPTESARVKSRFQSPSDDSMETLDKSALGSAKKRLSFPASPASARRHSGPPKVDVTSIKDVKVHS